jgi:hypothetical protein
LAPDGIAAIEREWDKLCAELKHSTDEPMTFVADESQDEHSSDTNLR